jgi:hypothetical protein
MSQIRNGTIKKADIGDEALKMYEDTLRSDSLISRDQNVRQEQMFNELKEEWILSLPRSKQSPTSNVHTGTAAEYVSGKYMNNMGSSSYSFVGDRFLKPSELWSNPDTAKYLETDPIALLDSVKRGTAAQAFDRQIYGNYFGIKGFGLKDLIEMYKKVGKEENVTTQWDMMFMTKDFGVDPKKRQMTREERGKFVKGVESIDRMYQYSVGTLSSLDNPHANAFLNALTYVGELGSALSVAPRIAVATLIEETPMSIGSVLKDNLLSARKEIQSALGSVRSNEELFEILEGLGHVSAHIMHKAGALAAKMGDSDLTGSYSASDRQKIKSLYAFLAKGSNKQTMMARSQGVMQYMYRVDKLFNNIAEGDILEAPDRTIRLTNQTDGMWHATIDEVYVRLQDKFKNDFSNITKGEFFGVLGDMGISKELRLNILEMVKAGLFEESKFKYFRNMWLENRETILKTGIPFNELRKEINFGFPERTLDNASPEDIRAKKLQVVNGLADLTFIASGKFSKQPTLSNQPLGARDAGMLHKFLSQLTTYPSSSAETLRRAAFAGTSMIVPAFLAHLISGYMYYKLVQLSSFRTIEEMKKEMQKDPLLEIQDAIMSVPFFGANQMVISLLLQMLRGQRPVNSKAFDIASLNAANSVLQIPARVLKAVGDIASGEWETGSAAIAYKIPIPHAWALAMALRNAGALESEDSYRSLSPNRSAITRSRGLTAPQVIPNTSAPNQNQLNPPLDTTEKKEDIPTFDVETGTWKDKRAEEAADVLEDIQDNIN